MRGRPKLYTSYTTETALFPTTLQKVMVGLFLVVLVLMPFDLPVINDLPLVRFLGDNSWLRPVNRMLIFAIAAVGLNLLSGVAGQVSLGHAFFMGVGASTAVLVGGASTSRLWGWGLPMWIWLPAAGLVAAAVGVLVAPAAVRVRGLYLGIATIGLVFIGIHLSRVFPEIAGPPQLGRKWPRLELRFWKEETPLVDFSRKGHWLWFDIGNNQKTYLLLLGVLVGLSLLAANLARSRTGRSWAAIRDRDVAAEIMGVAEFRAKTTAFAISSFYAGVAGALLASLSGYMYPEAWNLLLSVELIAILLIGGMGRISGALMGSFFVALSPRFLEESVRWAAEQAEGDGVIAGIWDSLISLGPSDFGFISVKEMAMGFPLPASSLDEIIYGLLIIVFLLFEPMGMFGIWIKIRNYWKGWPFSY